METHILGNLASLSEEENGSFHPDWHKNEFKTGKTEMGKAY